MFRKHVGKLAVCVALLMCLFATQTLAKQLVMTNKSTSKIFVAVCYKDATTDEWVVRGWYTVDALSKSTVDVNTNNSLIYLHGMAGKISWTCKGKDTSRSFYIVSDKFLYKKDKQRPQGKNLRSASFCMTKLTNNGNFAFIFND